jgi:hypothetical protein
MLRKIKTVFVMLQLRRKVEDKPVGFARRLEEVVAEIGVLCLIYPKKTRRFSQPLPLQARSLHTLFAV